MPVVSIDNLHLRVLCGLYPSPMQKTLNIVYYFVFWYLKISSNVVMKPFIDIIPQLSG